MEPCPTLTRPIGDCLAHHWYNSPRARLSTRRSPKCSTRGHWRCLQTVQATTASYSGPEASWKVLSGDRLVTAQKSIHQTPFKMETSATVFQTIKKEDWMLSLDLKDAYFQVPIHHQSRKFLRVVRRRVTYQVWALCLILCTAL